MNRVILPALAALAIAIGPAAPAAAQNREHLQLLGDIRMLQEQAQQLRALLTSLTETLKTVDARLNTKLDEQANLTRKAFADQKLLADNLADDVRLLREKLDNTNVRISSLSEEIEGLRVSAFAAVPPPDAAAAGAAPAGAAGTAPAPGSPGAAPTPSAAPAAAAPAVTPGAPPQRLYDQAYADYTVGQWELAIQGFESYIKTFPRSERADDAQFNIGQTYYNAGRFPEAVQAYDRLIAEYPSSDTLPDGLYKRGLALERIGEVARAREGWELLLKNYPETPAAILAKQALDRLSRQQGKK